MELNVDMGERGFSNPEDLSLLPYVDRVNLALGGHAGDERTAQDFEMRALALGKKVSLHPSYPDRENFGRRDMKISFEELRESLSSQRKVLSEVKSVKFHGALYNRAAVDEDLARELSRWCSNEGIEEILCPPNSMQEQWAVECGLRVVREGFADRAYVETEQGHISLMSRALPSAVLDNKMALAQVQEGVSRKRVSVLGGDAHHWRDGEWDTWCIHSDREGALELALEIKRWLAER